MQRNTDRDEAEPGLTRFHERDILGGPLGRAHDHRKAEVTRQDPGEARAIYVVRTAGRGGGDSQVIGPIGLGCPTGRGENETSSHDGGMDQQVHPHGLLLHSAQDIGATD